MRTPGKDEDHVVDNLVRPELERLGWRSSELREQYQLSEGRRVDFALGNPVQVLLEAKAESLADRDAALQQLHTYARDVPHDALLWLTDGRMWKLFIRRGELIGTVVKLERQQQRFEAQLEQFLGRDRVCAGTAWADAATTFEKCGRIEDQRFQEYFTVSRIYIGRRCLTGTRRRLERIRDAAWDRFGDHVVLPSEFESWLAADPIAPKVKSAKDARKRTAQLYKNEGLFAAQADSTGDL